MRTVSESFSRDSPHLLMCYCCYLNNVLCCVYCSALLYKFSEINVIIDNFARKGHFTPSRAILIF